MSTRRKGTCDAPEVSTIITHNPSSTSPERDKVIDGHQGGAPGRPWGCPFSGRGRVEAEMVRQSSVGGVARKISNISVASSQGLGEEEEDAQAQEKRLQLGNMVDAVQSLILPSVSQNLN